MEADARDDEGTQAVAKRKKVFDQETIVVLLSTLGVVGVMGYGLVKLLLASLE